MQLKNSICEEKKLGIQIMTKLKNLTHGKTKQPKL